MTAFGYEFRRKYFSLIEQDVAPINHGSFGVTPSSVLEHQRTLIETEEKYSDKFFFLNAPDEYIKQLKLLGSYLGVNYQNLALVSNATTAVNAVLRSIPWDSATDKILFHSTSYTACCNTVLFLNDYFNVQHDVVELQYPLEDDEVISQFEKKLASGEYKLCLFDMISSMPGVMVPYEQLILLCQKYNVWTLLDGAHAAGQVDLRFLDRLKPDFMTSNLHKWLYVPKSCAMLYVNPKHHDLIQTFPVSWSYGTKRLPSPSTPDDIEYNHHVLVNKFSFVGTVTYAQMLCVEEAIKFRSEVCGGETNIRKYQYELQAKAVEEIKRIFGPGAELLQNSTKSLTPPGLFNVSLPIEEKYFALLARLQDDSSYFIKFKNKCFKKMITENKAFAPFIIHNRKLWVRFSVNVYNEVEDYTKGAASVAAVVEQVLKELAISS